MVGSHDTHVIAVMGSRSRGCGHGIGSYSGTGRQLDQPYPGPQKLAVPSSGPATLTEIYHMLRVSITGLS
jgi:hypothetical protein